MMTKQYSQLFGKRIGVSPLSASVALLLTLIASSRGQSYTTGSLDGQNGWGGGAVPGFLTNVPGSEAVTTADAHTGLQSWRYSDGYNSPGGGTVYSPGLSQVAIESSAINTFTTTLWFKPVSATGDDSRIAVEFGDSPGSDRSAGTLYLRNDVGTGLFISIAEPIGPTGLPTDTQIVTLASGVDPTIWHQLAITGSFISGTYNDVLSVSIDGATATLHDSWLEWYRDDNTFSPEDSNRLKFREFNSANDSDPSYTTRGFYFDDITYSSYDSTNRSGTEVIFTTSFEPVPEPSTALLLLGSASALLLRRSRTAVR